MKTLGSLVIVIASLAGGCVVRGHAHMGVVAPAPVMVVEVEEAPPPPRVVTFEARPGFIWIEGRWHRHGNRWEWRDGYYERERANAVYVQGRWEQRGNRHVWVDGRWNAGARVETGPTVRDHRDNGNHNGGGPTVRDHRH